MGLRVHFKRIKAGLALSRAVDQFEKERAKMGNDYNFSTTLAKAAKDFKRMPLQTERGGCAEFCVNGQSTAGVSRPVRKHNEHQETRRT